MMVFVWVLDCAFPPYEPEPPSRPGEMNYFAILLSLPSHWPATVGVPLGLKIFSHAKNKLSMA